VDGLSLLSGQRPGSHLQGGSFNKLLRWLLVRKQGFDFMVQFRVSGASCAQELQSLACFAL
jgi:hypothetical protein